MTASTVEPSGLSFYSHGGLILVVSFSRFNPSSSFFPHRSIYRVFIVVIVVMFLRDSLMCIDRLSLFSPFHPLPCRVVPLKTIRTTRVARCFFSSLFFLALTISTSTCLSLAAFRFRTIASIPSWIICIIL